ncbi:hypothetical protein E2320_009399 [Naja naja]|nr:hypothetical protein E2320_009399 [Naja naja]
MGSRLPWGSTPGESLILGIFSSAEKNNGRCPGDPPDKISECQTDRECPGGRSVAIIVPWLSARILSKLWFQLPSWSPVSPSAPLGVSPPHLDPCPPPHVRGRGAERQHIVLQGGLPERVPSRGKSTVQT